MVGGVKSVDTWIEMMDFLYERIAEHYTEE